MVSARIGRGQMVPKKGNNGKFTCLFCNRAFTISSSSGSTSIVQLHKRPLVLPGVRPIAVGKALGRLVSTRAMVASSEIGPALAPLQVGAEINGGAILLGHGTKAAIIAHEQDVTLQLDCKNAFNRVSQQ